MQSECTGTHRHARVDANNNHRENGINRKTWVHQVAGAMEEQVREDQQEFKTQQHKKVDKDNGAR